MHVSARSTTGLARSLWDMEGQRAACHSKKRKKAAAVPMAGNSENTPWKPIPLCVVMTILRYQPFILQRMVINNFYIILGVCKVLLWVLFYMSHRVRDSSALVDSSDPCASTSWKWSPFSSGAMETGVPRGCDSVLRLNAFALRSLRNERRLKNK